MYKPNLNFCLPGEGRSKGQQGIDWSLCSWDKLFYLDENLTTENTGEYFYTFVLEISCSIWMRTSILRILVNISIPLFLRRVVLSWFEPRYRENTGEYFFTFVLEISCSIWMRTSLLRILVNIQVNWAAGSASPRIYNNSIKQSIHISIHISIN